MGLLESMLKQTAVYWPPGSAESGGVDFNERGERLYATAVQIKCRWTDVSKVFINAQGVEQVSRAKVFVDRDVKAGGMLYLGRLTDVAYLTDPKANDGAWEIASFKKTPNKRATKFLRKVFL